MSWLSSNWIWILLVGFVALHLFGHRGHRHGFAHGHNADDRSSGQPSLPGGEEQGTASSSAAGTMHEHADAGVAGSGSTAQGAEDRQQHRHHGC